MTREDFLREKWKTNSGFILACIGSAIGVGNIWRFPYIAGENGGGAFLIPYFTILASFGLVLMMLEFAVGRRYKKSVVSALQNISKNSKWAGLLIVAVAFTVLSYYLVILGWILSYIFISFNGKFVSFTSYTDTFYPVLAFFGILGVTWYVVTKGIAKGIETFNKYGIIILIIIIIPLTVYSISLPESEKGLEFFFEADHSMIFEGDVWVNALGQTFFSLSLGTGSLLTYASYLRGEHSLIKSSSIIIVSNTAISIMAGIMIFSFVFAYGADPASGVPLIFEILPTIFFDLDGGHLISAVFFILLLIAGLTSAIGLFQVPTSMLQDSLNFSKQKASMTICSAVAIVGVFSALSYTPANVMIFGSKFLDVLDSFVGTYGITVAELVFVVVVAWFMNKKYLLENLNASSKIKLPSQVIWILKIPIPIIIIIVLIFSV